MKKILLLLFLFSFSLVLVGCDIDDDDDFSQREDVYTFENIEFENDFLG